MIYEEKFNINYHSEGNSFPLSTFVHGGDSPPHWHDYMEFLYCVRGRFFVAIDENSVHCRRGELVLINSKAPHRTYPLEEDSVIQVLHFSPALLYSHMGYDTYLGHYMTHMSGKLKMIQKCDCRGKETEKIFKDLLEEYTSKNTTYELRCVAYVLLILSDLIRDGSICFGDVDSVKREAFEKLQPVLEYLRENYMQEITLREISDMVYMSKSAFCKLFKETMGMTFKEYLNEIRLAEAKKLLVMESRSITYIANEVGYPSVNYFNRVFRQKTGNTPSGFRREFKKNFK